ncbi:MAG: ABC transporter ATP-binding protein [Chloroflexi bacterium]|jgi:iron(III) transport system ATP-binding protein|nr:ABC transporter ATP-binding protein [Chloroflexota bacterium]MBT3669442.1 ABC transporter ATP-binding protein [Chloroflexota bacterium]MBT4002840.1 ABC transporter ATP-binding protein [Chloroflexota bacterium]MBT4304539.1 ABC transporter ATP-binding protein [Chloroflexota bacterium]MBT4534120.1 ABC transporter ATP-binding protein [Chloroflexota bacterium]
MQQYSVITENLNKSFDVDSVLKNLDLKIIKGEIMAIVGPSGCGKTTTLRLIAGFEQPDKGKIILGDTIVADEKTFLPPEKRGVGMVFQDFALFPHLTVAENISFGIKSKDKEKIREEVDSLLELVALNNLGDRFPHELSGGQRQRVSLARALAPKPDLILMDEPFSNIDADTRLIIREEVRKILKKLKTTAIFVTHDQEEALFMGDRLAVMNEGELEQIGTPENVFQQPKSRFVAEFMGNTDFIPGVISKKGIKTEIGELEQRINLPIGTKIDIAVRFDDLKLKKSKKPNAIVLARHFKGSMNIYRLQLPSGNILHAYAKHTKTIELGKFVKVKLDPGHDLACFIGEKAL